MSSLDDITKRGVEKHQKRVNFSQKVKVLSKRLDPIVKKILREVGDAQSKWMRETKKEPWDTTKPSSLPLILDLARFLYTETSHGKYRYKINGYFGLGPPYQSYYWRLKWVRSFSFSTDWGATLHVQDDGIVVLGIDAAYNLPKYKAPNPIVDVENLSFSEIEIQLREQALQVYKDKIGI